MGDDDCDSKDWGSCEWAGGCWPEGGSRRRTRFRCERLARLASEEAESVRGMASLKTLMREEQCFGSIVAIRTSVVAIRFRGAKEEEAEEAEEAAEEPELSHDNRSWICWRWRGSTSLNRNRTGSSPIEADRELFEGR